MYFSNKLILSTLIFILISACQAPSEKIEQASADPFDTMTSLEWIDLSYSFDSTTLYWPNNPLGFQLDVEAEGITDLGYYYSSNSLTTPEHGGTHLDAPIHFSESGKTMDELTLDQLTGEAVLIDVSEQALPNSDYLVDTAAILGWESQHGIIPENTIVLFRTGYGAFYPDREKYFGTAKMGMEAIPELHFPGISPEAASFLAEKRRVKAVGLDTPSLDFGQSKEFKTHQILMGYNIPGFENMANLNQLPEKGIYIIALPMKIKGGSGGPLRVIAGIKK
ncbi:cyclase family protein [Algoriphagus machipongonensis]|uniref:Cyclase family protein n=1 Tax=Algoriphagus machipongonensis TaxID=388413 RepID=A3HYP4_9BACT|nr:cyclase family protein [Algoriphagus machipongonensis]EAZ80380.1 cyclase family protein [Algoriphagus machipongonensis]